MLRHTLVSRITLFPSASFASLLLEHPPYSPPQHTHTHDTILSPERANTASYEFKKKLFEESFTGI